MSLFLIAVPLWIAFVLWMTSRDDIKPAVTAIVVVIFLNWRLVHFALQSDGQSAAAAKAEAARHGREIGVFTVHFCVMNPTARSVDLLLPIA